MNPVNHGSVVLSYQNQKTQGVEKTYLFRTYKNLHKGANHNERLLDRNPGLAHDVPIWKVARATSSAPTYFQTTKINGHEYLDGGFGANNPCIEIYDEVRKMNNNSEDFGSIILSIGTGKNGAKRLTGVNGLSRYLNYLNFAKKWATDSEGTHNAMLKKIERGDIKFPYYRFNLEDGLGAMKLDEWRVRGPLRTKFGKIIGNMRSPGKRVSISGHSHMGEKCPDWGLSKEMNDESSNLQASAAESTVPKWLQPKNETLESITEYTEKYLAQDQVQEMIQKTAEILVKNRRDRVGSNEQRWKKACFGAWYQCNIERCQRAETEYKDREALKRHLLDKHRDRFSKNPQEQEKLEKALDMCEVVVH